MSNRNPTHESAGHGPPHNNDNHGGGNPGVVYPVGGPVLSQHIHPPRVPLIPGMPPMGLWPPLQHPQMIPGLLSFPALPTPGPSHPPHLVHAGPMTGGLPFLPPGMPFDKRRPLHPLKALNEPAGAMLNPPFALHMPRMPVPFRPAASPPLAPATAPIIATSPLLPPPVVGNILQPTPLNPTFLHATIDQLGKNIYEVKNAMDCVHFTIPSIFRCRLGFVLRSCEVEVLESVVEVQRLLLFLHLAAGFNETFPLKWSGPSGTKWRPGHFKCFCFEKRVAIVDKGALLKTFCTDANVEWAPAFWEGDVSKIAYIKLPQDMSKLPAVCIVVQELNSKVLVDYLDNLVVASSNAPDCILLFLGYFCLTCDDDNYLDFVANVVPLLDAGMLVKMFAALAQILEPSKFDVQLLYLERVIERILPICLSCNDPKAYNGIVLALLYNINVSLCGSSQAHIRFAISSLRTLKSYSNIITKSAETCVAVFYRCLVLILQCSDDSMILLRGDATDLAMQVWLNDQGKESVLSRMGYDIVRILGCLCNITSIKLNILFHLLEQRPHLNNTAIHANLLNVCLARTDAFETLESMLTPQQSGIIKRLLQPGFDVKNAPIWLNWYLWRFIKTNHVQRKNVEGDEFESDSSSLALEGITILVRYAIHYRAQLALQAYASDCVDHANSATAFGYKTNLGQLVLWLFKVASNRSDGAACLEIANLKMAIICDWLFYGWNFNIQMLSRITRLHPVNHPLEKSTKSIAEPAEYSHLLIKHLVQPIFYILACHEKQQYTSQGANEGSRNAALIFGQAEILEYCVASDIDIGRMLIDYLINAIWFYHENVSLVALNVICSIFTCTLMSLLFKRVATSSVNSLTRELQSTILGRVYSVFGLSFASAKVYIVDVPYTRNGPLDLTAAGTSLVKLETNARAFKPGKGYKKVVSIQYSQRQLHLDEVCIFVLTQAYALVLEFYLNAHIFTTLVGKGSTLGIFYDNFHLENIVNGKCLDLYDELLVDASEVCNDECAAMLQQVVGTATLEETIEWFSQHVNQEANYLCSCSGILNVKDHANVNLEDAVEALTFQIYRPQNLNAEDGTSNISEPEYNAGKAIDAIISYLVALLLRNESTDDKSSLATSNTLHPLDAFLFWVYTLEKVELKSCGIAWQLLYYIAATRLACIYQQGHSSFSASTPQSSRLETETTGATRLIGYKSHVSVALFFNIVHSLANKQSVTKCNESSIDSHENNDDSALIIVGTLQNTLKCGLEKQHGAFGNSVQALIPLRMVLELLIHDELLWTHFKATAGYIVSLLIRISPLTSLVSFYSTFSSLRFGLETRHLLGPCRHCDFNFFSAAFTSNDQARTDTLLQLLFSSLDSRQGFITWQLVICMYEAANLPSNSKAQAAILKCRSSAIASVVVELPDDKSRHELQSLPYVTPRLVQQYTGEELNLDPDAYLVFLDYHHKENANNKCSLLCLCKGYTLPTSCYLNNKHLGVLTGLILQSCSLQRLEYAQAAMFSCFSALAHSTPTDEAFDKLLEIGKTLHDMDMEKVVSNSSITRGSNTNTSETLALLRAMVQALVLFWTQVDIAHYYNRLVQGSFLENGTNSSSSWFTMTTRQLVAQYASRGQDHIHFVFNHCLVKVPMPVAQLLLVL